MKVFSLLSSFFTVLLIFLTSDVVLQFGAYGGIILCASFFTAALLIYLLRNKLFRNQFRHYKKPILYGMLILYLLETFTLHSWIIVSIVDFIGDNRLPYLLICGSTTLVLILMLAGKISNYIANTLILINLSLIFIMAIMLPNFIYLQKGLETVYHNLVHYHPRVLHRDREGLWPLFFMLTIVFFVKLSIILYIHSIGLKKLKSYLFLISLCVGSVMLAFSTMVIVAVTERIQTNHPNVLIISMLKKLMNPYIFTFVWMSMIIGSLISLLVTLIFIIKKIGKVTLKKNHYVISIILMMCVVTFQYVYLKDVYVLDILMFGAVMQIPFVMIVNFGKTNKTHFYMMLIFILVMNMLLMGFTYTMVFQVITTAIVSMFIMLILNIVENKKKSMF